MHLTQGVLYVATGEQYLAEAEQSARSVKKIMPDIMVALFTDVANYKSEFIDIVLSLSEVKHSYVDKILPLKDSPFEKTLFLDTDTYVCENIEEMFSLLDRFDLAAAHTPYRKTRDILINKCPESFPELNTGVLLFRKSELTEKLFRDWYSIFHEQINKGYQGHDQPAFRLAIYLSDLKFYVLTPEYNFRSLGPGYVGANAKVKIIHGRNENMEELAQIINEPSDWGRTIVPNFNAFHIYNFRMMKKKYQDLLAYRIMLKMLRLLK